VSPRVQLSGFDRFLNGVDIIEAQAHFLASQFSQVFRGAPVESFMASGLSPKYWFAFVWFCKTVGERYAHLFPMVCDLALMTIWNDDPKTEHEWRATCPGWRFVILAQQISSALPEPPDESRIMAEYKATADHLLERCGFASVDASIDAALVRGTWRSPLMQLEKRMLDAISFRKNHPWCVAYPWLSADVWHRLCDSFPGPLLQVEGKLKASSRSPQLNHDAEAFMNEVGGELMLQAWALQLLEIPPATAGPEGTIQCGFRYFDVENVCPHQIADACPGSFKPQEGSPHPADLTDEETLLGCPFEKLLASAGVNVKSIRLPERPRERE
jgi:hypothetical protein